MVNILIMNSSQFHKAIQLSPERLFEDFKSLIETVLSRFSRQTEEKPELAVIDSCHGECSILLPNATDKLSSDMCKALKESIRSYFAKKNAKSVFVNIASLLLSPFGKPVPMHEVSANLNIKQVYIGTETRLAQRVRYLAHIDVLLAPGKKEPTRTIDISKGGLCFTSQIPFKINSEIKISLKLPIYPKPIPIKGRVAWIKETGSLEPENLTTYKLGVEFVHLKKRYRRNISRFMDSLLS